MQFGGLDALNNVEHHGAEGQRGGVIGPNGSGKSTLFNVITGLVPAEEGSIRFHGEEIMGLPALPDPRAGHRAHLPEPAAVHQPDRDGERAGRPARAAEDRHARRRSCARRARRPRRGRRANGRWRSSAIFGNRLMPRVEQVVAGLSYANRRRIEIARALASRPRMLLLDEPTAGMNPAETLELADQIRSLNGLGTDGAADRAQAGRGDHAGRHGLSCSTTARRSPRASRTRCGATRRCCAPISGASAGADGGRGSMLPEAACHAARVSNGRRHLLRRAPRPEGGELHDRARARSSACSAAMPRASPPP